MSKVLNRICYICTLLSISITGNASDPASDSALIAAEEQLSVNYQAIFQQPVYQRAAPAEAFYKAFRETLMSDNSFHYPFNQLKGMGKIYSPDEQIRIYSWNVPLGIEDNNYYGIVQFYSKRDKQYKLVFLDELINEGEEKFKRKWDEALYYSIVESKHAGQRYYTLLGFDMATPLSNKKIVDVVAIDEFDDLYFCKNLIYYEGKRTNRLQFEYNEQVVMSLRYDDDKKLIVFDHLSPTKPSLEGKYEFYGPDLSYDALKWEKGIWVHLSNIDISN